MKNALQRIELIYERLHSFSSVYDMVTDLKSQKIFCSRKITDMQMNIKLRCIRQYMK